MPLPLIIKAAAIGGAAYAASRWLAGQRRNRTMSDSPYATATGDAAGRTSPSSVRRETHPGENAPGSTGSAGPTS